MSQRTLLKQLLSGVTWGGALALGGCVQDADEAPDARPSQAQQDAARALPDAARALPDAARALPDADRPAPDAQVADAAPDAQVVDAAPDALVSDAAPDAQVADVGPPAPDLGAPYPPVPELQTDCEGDVPPDAEQGPCCDAVHCYEADDDRCRVADADDWDSKWGIVEALGLGGYGSGECLCDVRGPFDPNSAAPFTDDEGRCCYVVTTNWCTGRPLVVAGEMRLAPVVERGDWS